MGGSRYPGAKYDDNLDQSFWRHIALSFNIRALKVYLDDTRLVNIPNVGCNPTGMTIGVPSFNSAGTKGINRFIKNIRIADIKQSECARSRSHSHSVLCRGDWTRTSGLYVPNVARYQLRYTPIFSTVANQPSLSRLA